PSEEEAPPGESAVQVLAMEAAKAREWAHVYVLGLHAAALPGAARRALDPIADALLKEAVPAATGSNHVAEMRRLLHVAMPRAAERLVLVYPAADERGANQPPSPLVEDARRALGAEWEDREEELFGPAESLHATYRILRDELLTTVGRTAGRLGEL